ncbi:MAG: diaminopimelate epimerase [Clostridia bacterium]|nr:diaminopimelate epimerase [Clostridia bacterium]
MRFTKMEGLGNDYIYVNLFTETVRLEDAPALARRISDRHFGVGSDGLVLIAPSDRADVRMIMYNADGSRGQMCGNASRCIARYAYERGIVPRTSMTLETDSGIKRMTLKVDNGSVREITVDMGEPVLERAAVPCTLEGPGLVVPMVVDGRMFEVIPVGVGNPNVVVLLGESLDTFDLAHYGALFETHPAFPNKTNAEFINCLGPDRIRMRVWERGSGITMACGSGACAAAVASIHYYNVSPELTVSLDGGDLFIAVRDGRMYMTGPAEFVCDGEYPAQGQVE